MATRRKAELLGAIDRLAQAEDAFVGTEFLAPVLCGAGVGVRIAGIRCRLTVRPADFEGWGVFAARSTTAADVLRPASWGERRKYLALFPVVRIILTGRERAHWTGVAANVGDGRFDIAGIVPVRFVEDGELFETVVTRFDGGQFWYDSADTRCDPGAAAFLRESLGRLAPPQSLDRRGLTAEQRTAYALIYRTRLAEIQLDERARGEDRLRAALQHAGADLRHCSEQGDVYRVSYAVDGTRHTSVVRKNDLSVVTAGICLSGRDRNFDLGSLVGVLREGRDRNRIVRTM
jgi:hypothetical protein